MKDGTHTGPNSGSQAVLRKMPLIRHDTSRSITKGAWGVCLVGEKLTCSVPEGLRSCTLRPCTTRVPRPPPTTASPHAQNAIIRSGCQGNESILDNIGFYPLYEGVFVFCGTICTPIGSLLHGLANTCDWAPWSRCTTTHQTKRRLFLRLAYAVGRRAAFSKELLPLPPTAAISSHIAAESKADELNLKLSDTEVYEMLSIQGSLSGWVHESMTTLLTTGQRQCPEKGVTLPDVVSHLFGRGSGSRFKVDVRRGCSTQRNRQSDPCLLLWPP